MRPVGGQVTPVEWCRVTTPMQVEAWEAVTEHSHNQTKTFVSYLVRGWRPRDLQSVRVRGENVQTSFKEHEIGGGQPSSG